MHPHTGIGDFLFSVSYFDRDLQYDADGTEYMFAFQQLSDEFEAYYDRAMELLSAKIGTDVESLAAEAWNRRR